MKKPVFDIGDTLLPSHEKINEAVKEELKEEGVKAPPEFPINNYNIYREEEIKQWLDENGLDAKSANIKGRYLQWEKDFFQENVLPELKKINQEFGPIGFISDNSIPAKKFYIGLFRDAGLDYRGFVVSEEVGVEKPGKEIFETFLEKREEPAEQLVYFGNYVERDKAAEKTGMKFVWVNQYHTFGSDPVKPSIKALTYREVERALKQVS